MARPLLKELLKEQHELEQKMRIARELCTTRQEELQKAEARHSTLRARHLLVEHDIAELRKRG